MAGLLAVVLALSGCDIFSRGDFFQEVDDTLNGNSPPIAVAGVDFGVTTGMTANLDGSGSFDPDGDVFTYEWTFISVPGGSGLSNASITGRLSSTASFVTDVDGTYNLELRVDDGEEIGIDTIVVVASTVNTPPLADAGIDQSVHTATTVNLDGNASSDPDLDPLSFLWTFDTVPGGSGLTDVDIAGIATPTPSFVPDVAGSFILRLTVDDGTDNDFDLVTISVNTPPLADAGSDQILGTGILVNLDGSGSSDPDLDPLSYLWTFDSVPGGSILTDPDILNSTTAAPSFTTDVGGSYVLRLVVDDGTDAGSDTVNVYANTAPVADAGTDINVTTGNTAVLDGSGSSDPDLDPLIFTWNFNTVPGGSMLTDGDIVDADTDAPSFVPDVDGLYVLRLVVDDGLDLDSDTVNVNATANTPPGADAGTDLSGFENTTFTLDGSGSNDADLDPITYLWTFDTQPGGSLLNNGDIQNSSTATPSFIPDVAGNFILQLEVSDSMDAQTDTVIVTSNAAELAGEWLFNSTGPIDTGLYANDGIADSTAIPAADRAGNPAHAYSFDGTNTATIYYGNDVTLDFTDAISVVCWVRPDDIVAEGRILSKRNSVPASGWELYIGDNAGTTTIYFMGNGTVIGDAPMAGTNNGDWAHIAVTWCPGDPADQLKFYYNGSPVSIVTTAVTMVSSTTGLYMGRPGYASVLNFLGAIDDARLYHGILSADDVAALHVLPAPNTAPVADAGVDLNGLGGSSVHLNGSASFDPNPADIITYSWEFMGTPGGSALINANIQDVNTSTPYFTPDLPGTYQLRLTVDDGSANAADIVDVNVAEVGPELVGEWMFSGGSLEDTSAYGSVGIPTNAVPTPDRDGNPDAAYYFNNNARIVLGNDPQLNQTDMITFSCWFRPDELDTGYGRIVSKRNSPTPEGWELTIGTGDTVSMNRSGTLAAENIGPGMIQGVWYHLAFTWDPNGPPDQAIFYLNGNPLPGTALSGGASMEPLASATPLTLGSAAYSLSNQFMGAIDDVRLYHGILTPPQIAELAAEPAVP